MLVVLWGWPASLAHEKDENDGHCMLGFWKKATALWVEQDQIRLFSTRNRDGVHDICRREARYPIVLEDGLDKNLKVYGVVNA